MSFEPVLPANGLVGWKLLTRTEDAQRELFNSRVDLSKDVAYFREKIASVGTAEELVSDRRLLKVALGAFGLDEEIDKKAFLRKMLEEGSESNDAFVNKFVDPRYKAFVKAFGFGNLAGARTQDPGFDDRITDAYRMRQFEVAVGQQDETLRLALNFRREIKTFANASDPEGSAWLSVLGDTAVRAVFDAAFNFGTSFAQLDVDRQRDEMKEKNDRFFGSKSLEVFKDPAKVDEMINRFLVRRSIDEGPSQSTPGVTALSMLQSSGGIGLGAGATQNLILSLARG